jgi:hypothetical protein
MELPLALFVEWDWKFATDRSASRLHNLQNPSYRVFLEKQIITREVQFPYVMEPTGGFIAVCTMSLPSHNWI